MPGATITLDPSRHQVRFPGQDVLHDDGPRELAEDVYNVADAVVGSLLLTLLRHAVTTEDGVLRGLRPPQAGR